MKAVYDFSEASGSNKKLLGGKGAGLSEMTRLKLPVPPGFVITTEEARHHMQPWWRVEWVNRALLEHQR